MADKKITELPAASLPISTGVKFEAVQGGINVQVDADDMPGSGAAGVASVTGTSVDNTDAANPVVNAVPTTIGANTTITLSADVWLRILGIAGTTPRFIIDGVNNTRRSLQFRTGGLPRWDIHIEGNETGANAAADLHFERYDDAGAFIDELISISRATGIMNFTIGPTAPTAAPGTNTTQVATTAFVQTAAALDADLADIAALTPTNDDVLQRKAGVWTNRSLAELRTDLAYGTAVGTWTPVWGGFSVDPAAVVAKYALIGKLCTVMLFCTDGTSNSTTTTVTLPFNADPDAVQFFPVMIVNGGTQALGRLGTTTGSSPVANINTSAGVGLSASGAKRAAFTLTYIIE